MTRVLFDALTSLLPPKSFDQADPNAVLVSCVENYLKVCNPNEVLIQQITGKEVHQAYCSCCLHHLHSYAEMDRSATEELLLSVSHLEKLKSCVEFLICLGVYPYLDSGVSIPLELRMEAHSCFRLPPVRSTTERERNLLNFAKCLLQFRVCRTEQLKRLTSPALFLGDVMASLMQVGYMPTGPSTNAGDHPSPNEFGREARHLLWNLLCELPGSVSMKELLILQGGSIGPQKIKGAVKLPPAPVWLRKTCGRLLSRLLVRGSTRSTADNRELLEDSGVRNLLLASASLAPGVIGSPTGCITSLDPRLQPALAQGLARILASKPAWLTERAMDKQCSTAASMRYFESIARQVLNLLSLKFAYIPAESSTNASETMTESVARFGALVGVATVHEFCSRDPVLGKRLLLEPLLSVLYCCVCTESCTDSSSTNTNTVPDCTDECELASVRQWNQSLDHFYSLLTCPARSPVVLSELIRLSGPIFRLLVHIHLDRIASMSREDELTDQNVRKPEHSDQQTDGESRSSITSLLSQILIFGLETRELRVALLRNWLLLQQHMPSPIPSPLSCHPRLQFRCPRRIHHVVGEQADHITDNQADPTAQITVPYRCVLTRESFDWLDHPDALSALIDSAMDVVNQVVPSSAPVSAQSVEEEVEDQAIPLIPSIDVAFGGSNQAEQSTAVSYLSSDLFLSLIADLNENLSQFLIEPQRTGEIQLIRSPVTPVGPEQTRAALISSMLAATMLDKMGDRIWPQNPDQLVQLFEMTFERLALLIGQAENEDSRTFLAETLSQLLGILAFYANQIGPSSECATSTTRDQFARLLPVLDGLERVCQTNSDVLNSSQRELLHCLRVLVATRGAVKLDQSDHTPTAQYNCPPEESFSPRVKVAEARKPATHRPLIEELPSVSVTPPETNEYPMDRTETLDPSLAEALEQLTDPLIPVRGHALIVLSRLLESRDSCVRGHEDRIFQALVRHLADTDSYIYLNAIRALSAMGLMLTDRVLHTLLDQFTQPCRNRARAIDSCVEFQLKLGEAIMRVLRDLGSTAPKYRNPVLNAMTLGTRASEPLIRAASLSNLGEMCRLLGHSIVPILYELFALIELHLIQDPEVCVRQAAANLARALLLPQLSQQSSLPSWLPPDLLRDLNRLLSNRAQIERDPSVREQIEAALGQLDQSVRSSLFRTPDTPQSLVKEIRVLRPFLN